MSLPGWALSAFCAAGLLFANSAVAEEDCSAEIRALEAAALKAKETQSEQDGLTIALAVATLEVLCDPFDEWEIGSPEDQKTKEENIAVLRKYAGDDEDDDLDF